MQLIDWIILFVPILALVAVAVFTHHYMKSVADFMSGGRLAGRYLLAVASGELGAGAVVFVSTFEVIYQSGFALGWWGKLVTPISIAIAISGFVIYRYRQTRVMTLAQFFEVRYSRSFRLFAGGLAFVAGILNFGIIPSVGARFLVYVLGLPAELHLGAMTLPTYIPLMGLFLTITVILTISGGFLTVMLTDCLEGIFSQLSYIIIILVLYASFSWPQLSHTLVTRPAGQSYVNPFDVGDLNDFNISYVVMTFFTGIYATMAWQNSGAYNTAALNAHESRMARLLGRWREYGKGCLITLLAICGITFLQNADFSVQSEHARYLISQISEPQIQSQMRIPIAISEMLPTGVKGLLCAVLLMGICGGDSTHLHSWSSILIQDVFLPLRKKQLTPQQHIRWLRIAVIGVALFAFLFGSLFRQTEYVAMWFQVTTGIFVGGAGSAIIGGLYWKKGTAQGAWASMVIGSLLSFGGIMARQWYGKEFPMNGTQIYFTASLIAVAIYIIVSLLTCRENFNMDRMLHRGPYAIAGEEEKKPQRKFSLGKLVGFDENFSLGDKWIAGWLMGWGVLMVVVIVSGTIWNMISPWSTTVWAGYWHVVAIIIPLVYAIITGIWFTWGGVRDIRDLFARMKNANINHRDDGTVVNHQNLADVVDPKATAAASNGSKA
jgi:solute:Na+ symporter, SSS family